MHLVIITRDRSDKLQRMLVQNRGWLSRLDVTLLDDSVDPRARRINKRACLTHGIAYHGPEEQRRLLENVELARYSALVSRLGTGSRTLPSARNYSVLLGIAHRAEWTLMMDDDLRLDPFFAKAVEERGPPIIHRLVGRAPAIGCEVVEFSDHSVLGHLCRVTGLATDFPEILTPRFQSGGLMAFRTSSARMPFPNVYNEDWIWLYLENGGRKPAGHFTVLQQSERPFVHVRSSARYQEFGEIAWWGVAQSRGSSATLLSPNFWGEVLGLRRHVLTDLSASLSRLPGGGRWRSAVDAALKEHRNLTARSVAESFRRYFQLRRPWAALMTEVTRRPKPTN